MFLDSKTVCKLLNFLLSYLNLRRYPVIDLDNPEWELEEIRYDEELDKFCFTTKEV